MLICVKGAGDIATGIACRLKNSGFSIIMTETAQPTSVRRTVCFSRCIYEGRAQVEGIKAVLARSRHEVHQIAEEGNIAVLVDPEAHICREMHPDAVVDAIIAKKNMGTHIEDAEIVIGVGPGFTAGVDCHAVVETQRGHFLGKVIWQGSAAENTGIPGDIGGYTLQRLIRAKADGVFHPLAQIGDKVTIGQPVCTVGKAITSAEIDGVVRGMLQDGAAVKKGMKCGDIDPRCVVSHCYTVSDKARSVGGGVLEAVLSLASRKGGIYGPTGR